MELNCTLDLTDDTPLMVHPADVSLALSAYLASRGADEVTKLMGAPSLYRDKDQADRDPFQKYLANLIAESHLYSDKYLSNYLGDFACFYRFGMFDKAKAVGESGEALDYTYFRREQLSILLAERNFRQIQGRLQGVGPAEFANRLPDGFFDHFLFAQLDPLTAQYLSFYLERIAWCRFAPVCYSKLLTEVANYADGTDDLIDEYESARCGPFAKLYLDSLPKATPFDPNTDWDDPLLCAILAIGIDDIEDYPEGLQLEFARMCRYVGVIRDDLPRIRDNDYLKKNYKPRPYLQTSFPACLDTVHVTSDVPLRYIVYTKREIEAWEHASEAEQSIAESLHLPEVNEQFQSLAQAVKTATAIERERREELIRALAGSSSRVQQQAAEAQFSGVFLKIVLADPNGEWQDL